MANDGAPVCQLPNQGQIPPSQPGRRLPSIPKAQDLPSLLAAINALTQTVNMLSSPLPPLPNNNLSLKQPNIPGFPLLQGGDADQSEKLRFVELGRTTEQVTIFNPDDDAQFIVTKQIGLITFMDTVTGSVLYWNRSI